MCIFNIDRQSKRLGWGWGGVYFEAREAIVSIDLDRTDNRFHGFNVLEGFHRFTYRTVRWATSKWNLWENKGCVYVFVHMCVCVVGGGGMPSSHADMPVSKTIGKFSWCSRGAYCSSWVLLFCFIFTAFLHIFD